MEKGALYTRIAISGILAVVLLVVGSAGPATSFNPSSDGSINCRRVSFPYARWAGDAISWKIGPLEGLPSGSDPAIAAAAATWTNTKRSRASFYRDENSNNRIVSDWIIWGARGWVDVTITNGLITRAQMYLNRYYGWPSGTTEVQKVALHEFGHWLWLEDIYGPNHGGGCPPYEQQHTDAVMYNADRTDLTWDEHFGAMFLYGPDYRGFEPDWGYWDQPEGGSGGCSSGLSNCQAHRVTEENGVPVIWDNSVPGMWSNKYLKVYGNPWGSGHQSAYMSLFDVNLTIEPNMHLRWHQFFYWDPWISLDARFSDGTYLRDYYLRDQNGYSIHPAERPYYPGGQWLWFDVDLNQDSGYGSVVGKTITQLMVGYDHGYGEGEYLGYIDNMNIGF